MKLFAVTYFNRRNDNRYTGLTAGFKELINVVKTTIAEESPVPVTEKEINIRQKEAKKTLKANKKQFDSGFIMNTSPNTFICIQELTHLDIQKANKVYLHQILKMYGKEGQ